MLWVDHTSYFGSNRRRKNAALRVRERRRHDYAQGAPSLSAALRQLRMHVLEARGPALTGFIQRILGVTLLAEMQHEPDAAFMLSRLATQLGREPDRDMRPEIYDTLDRVQGVMLEYH